MKNENLQWELNFKKSSAVQRIVNNVSWIEDRLERIKEEVKKYENDKNYKLSLNSLGELQATGNALDNGIGQLCGVQEAIEAIERFDK